MKSWKTIKTELNISEIFENYMNLRDHYLDDPRWLLCAELKWDGYDEVANDLTHLIDSEHPDYFRVKKEWEELVKSK